MPGGSILCASKSGHAQVLKCLHTEFGLAAEDAHAWNNEPLRWASQRGHLEVVKYLLEKDTAKGISKQAYNKILRADKFYSKGLQRIEDYLEPIMKVADPDRIVSVLLQSAKEGATRINAIKK